MRNVHSMMFIWKTVWNMLSCNAMRACFQWKTGSTLEVTGFTEVKNIIFEST